MYATVAVELDTDFAGGPVTVLADERERAGARA